MSLDDRIRRICCNIMGDPDPRRLGLTSIMPAIPVNSALLASLIPMGATLFRAAMIPLSRAIIPDDQFVRLSPFEVHRIAGSRRLMARYTDEIIPTVRLEVWCTQSTSLSAFNLRLVQEDEGGREHIVNENLIAFGLSTRVPIPQFLPSGSFAIILWPVISSPARRMILQRIFITEIIAASLKNDVLQFQRYSTELRTLMALDEPIINMLYAARLEAREHWSYY